MKLVDIQDVIENKRELQRARAQEILEECMGNARREYVKIMEQEKIPLHLGLWDSSGGKND